MGNTVLAQELDGGAVSPQYPDRPEWHLCHETIYQAVYLGCKGGLSRALTTKLCTVRPLC
jgi:hypothetical protein